MKKEIATAFKWDFIGKIGNQSFGFIITIILARILVPADFGLLAMIVAFSSLVNGFVNFGFSSAIVQKQEVNQKETSTVFFFNITIGVFLTVLFYSCSNIIGRFYENESIINIAKLFSITFFINSLGLVGLALLEKELQFKKIMKLQLISGICSGIIGVSLALTGYGVWALVIQSLTNEFLRALLSFFYSKFRPNLYFSLTAIKPLWKYGSNLFVSGLLNSIFFRIDYLLIGKFFPAALLGLFYRAKSFRTLIMRYTSDSLGKVLFPTFSKKQNDLNWISNSVEKSMIITVYLIAFLSTGLFVLGKEIFIILFSEKWLDSVPYFRILIISSITFPMISILGNVLNGLGFSKKFLVTDLFEKAGLLIGIIMAIYTMNFMIYLYVDLIVRFLSVGLFLNEVKKVIPLSLYKIYTSIILVSIISVLSVFGTNFGTNFYLIQNVFITGVFKGLVFVLLFSSLSFIDFKFNKNSAVTFLINLVSKKK